MNRRQFLVGSAVTFVAAAGAVGYQSQQYQPDLALLRHRLEQWQGIALTSDGQWQVSEIFQHLSQSVLGSLHGFPTLKPSWFRHTIGPMALQVFKARGRMSHPLAEPIPGMPAFDMTLSSEAALTQLLTALEQLSQASQFQPHFAYGQLNKTDVIAAHVLHIEQHLSEIRPQTLKAPGSS